MAEKQKEKEPRKSSQSDINADSLQNNKNEVDGATGNSQKKNAEAGSNIPKNISNMKQKHIDEIDQ